MRECKACGHTPGADAELIRPHTRQKPGHTPGDTPAETAARRQETTSETVRQRRIPDLWANDRLYERAYHLLKDPDPRLRLTIYRLNGDQRLKPAVLRCQS